MTFSTETVAFGLDGVGVEIDLKTKHAKAIRKALAEFLAASRDVKPGSPIVRAPRPLDGRRAAGRPTNSPDAVSPKDVRGWAETQGIGSA